MKRRRPSILGGVFEYDEFFRLFKTITSVLALLIYIVITSSLYRISYINVGEVAVYLIVIVLSIIMSLYITKNPIYIEEARRRKKQYRYKQSILYTQSAILAIIVVMYSLLIYAKLT